MQINAENCWDYRGRHVEALSAAHFPLKSLLTVPKVLSSLLFLILLQICVGKNEEIDGFLRLSSGKKRGLVPVQCLLEIWWQFKITVMEEYSGVLSQHQPPTFGPHSKSGSEFAAWVDTDPQLCFFFTAEDILGGFLRATIHCSTTLLCVVLYTLKREM